MTNSWVDNPIFLAGHRKTGTTLLLSLFDSHPELSVFPPDSGFWYAYYPAYDSDEYDDQAKKARIAEVMFGNFIADLKDIDPQQAEKFSVEQLQNELEQELGGVECSPGNLLGAVMKVFQRVINSSDSTPTAWVEKTTSTEIYANDIFEWFPNAKVVHLLRDPRDNFGSLKSGWQKRYQHMNDSLERLLQSMIDRGGMGLKMAAFNQEQFGPERYCVIKYEDLTSNAEPVMKQLAEFVGVSFDETLLRPTYFGHPWGGNNFDGLSFDKPSAVNVGRWKERINDHEAALIEFHLQNEMKRWNYEPELPAAQLTKAAAEHYKWFNNAQLFSVQTTASPTSE